MLLVSYTKRRSYANRKFDGWEAESRFDTVGRANLTNTSEAAALNAQISTTVSLLELDLTPVHFKGLPLNVVFMLIPMLYDHHREAHGANLAELARIADSGAFKPVLDDVAFGCSDVDAACDRLTGGKAIGKVVIEI
ncbi:zinc-binding dehydrogenase [Labrenzia sp. 011]|uniref:zinc-binding dehydrogenase n=1 Tax=Labrenzia sp. 011 TaxID=2171494 RepID=UPI000D51964E|nr:zinc-binding dehydrogenase [Labrenzia sp. 011]PVB59737.1 hypothetical protein DCO57_20695 [Labrenzia sp. 011]